MSPSSRLLVFLMIPLVAMIAWGGNSQFKQITPGITVGNLSGDPAFARPGDFYFNKTTHNLRFYNGTIWNDVGTGGGGGLGIGASFITHYSTCPNGSLAEDGSAISRTTYSALFTAIGVTAGPGDGSTTFNLPDARGRLLRIWDNGAGNDPDAGSRFALFGGGNTGDMVNTYQNDAFQDHVHSVNFHGNSPVVTSFFASSAGGVASSGNTNGAASGNAASETRPRNLGVQLCIVWQSASSPRSEVFVTGGSGHGSTNTDIRIFATGVTNTGTDITYATDPSLGDSFTINSNGIYAISYDDGSVSSRAYFGVSKNTTGPTTSIRSISNTERLGMVANPLTFPGDVSFSTILSAGDVIRAHDDGGASLTANSDVSFRIVKVNN